MDSNIPYDHVSDTIILPCRNARALKILSLDESSGTAVLHVLAQEGWF